MNQFIYYILTTSSSKILGMKQATNDSEPDFIGLFAVIFIIPVLFAILIAVYSYKYWYIPRKELNKQKKELSRAIRLKYSGKQEKRDQATQILNHFVDTQTNTSDDLTTVAYLLYLQSVVVEVKKTKNVDLLKTVNTKLEELIDLVRRSKSVAVIPEIYLLQAKLALVNYNFDEAQRLFNKAELFIDERGLKSIKEVLLSGDLFTDSGWKRMKEENAPMMDRLNKVKLDDHLERVASEVIQNIHGLPKDIPVWFSFNLDSGLSLFQYNFGETQLNDQLVGGFITAMNSFIKEALHEGGKIEQLRYGEFHLLMRSVGYVNFCYVVRGSPREGQENLNKLSEQLKCNDKFWTKFNKEDVPDIRDDDVSLFNNVIEEVLFSEANN